MRDQKGCPHSRVHLGGWLSAFDTMKDADLWGLAIRQRGHAEPRIPRLSLHASDESISTVQ